MGFGTFVQIVPTDDVPFDEILNSLVFLTRVSSALEFGRFITAHTITFRNQYFAKGQRGAKSLLANVQHGGLE